MECNVMLMWPICVCGFFFYLQLVFTVLRAAMLPKKMLYTYAGCRAPCRKVSVYLWAIQRLLSLLAHFTFWISLNLGVWQQNFPQRWFIQRWVCFHDVWRLMMKTVFQFWSMLHCVWSRQLSIQQTYKVRFSMHTFPQQSHKSKWLFKRRQVRFWTSWN